MSLIKTFYTMCMDLGKYVSNLPITAQIMVYIFMIFAYVKLIKGIHADFKNIVDMMSS
ncbi:MAG: hypothetical protein ACOCRX_11220 [Candidatus Woesearchaeota archaeon]